MTAYSHIAPIAGLCREPEKQTMMGFAYDHRQKFKDSEYIELCELIQETENKKKKYVKITYRKIFMKWHECDCGECETGTSLAQDFAPIVAIFEIVPNSALKDVWDKTKITEAQFKEWKQTHLIIPYEPLCVDERGDGVPGVRAGDDTRWVLEKYEEL